MQNGSPGREDITKAFMELFISLFVNISFVRFYIFFLIERLTFTRERAMENKTFYGDGFCVW